MAKKYYAVKSGRKTGIFESWVETEKSVSGYPNAAYKSFSNLEDAKRFLSGGETSLENQISKISNSVDVFVDGSFSEEKSMYSYGIVFLKNDIVIDKMSGVGVDKELLPMRNVAGELEGAMQSISWAVSNKYDQIIVHYDYMGIEKWATGEWKANKIGTKAYKEFIQRHKNLISIKFVKVKAHSGVVFNEIVDKLASEAIRNDHDYLDSKSSYYDMVTKDEFNSDTNKKYLNLLERILSNNSTEKNIVTFKFGKLRLSTSQIDKFIKAAWKEEKRLIKEIDYFDAVFDSNRSILEWNVYDIKGEQFSFKLMVEGEMN